MTQSTPCILHRLPLQSAYLQAPLYPLSIHTVLQRLSTPSRAAAAPASRAAAAPASRAEIVLSW